MAITVQYSPDAQLVAQAAMTAGQGDYNRWAAQQALQQQELQQQKDLTFFNAANQQYQQRIGILDTQHRQTQQIQASQTEQLRNIANQQGLAQYDAYNTNYRFAGGIANEQYLQDERIAYQDRSDIRGIEAQNQRTTQALEMERLNTLSKLQAQQQSQQFEAQQRMASQFLDGQQRAGLMQLQAGLSSQQRQAEQSFDIARMNYATKQQLDLSSTLADANFRRQNFLGEYQPYLEGMEQSQYESRQRQLNQQNAMAMEWLQKTGFDKDPNIVTQVKQNLMNQAMGLKAQAPVYTAAEADFLKSKVKHNGVEFIRTPNGGFDALPDPMAREKEVRLRGYNEAVSNSMKMAYERSQAVYDALMEQAAEKTPPPGINRNAFMAQLKLEATNASREAYTATLRESIEWTTGVTGTTAADVAGM